MDASVSELIIDNRTSGTLKSNAGNDWQMRTDNVMGGVSKGGLTVHEHLGKACLRMQGQVSTENNGGFVQMSLSVSNQIMFDAYQYAGVFLEVAGNSESYNLHLRTANLSLPWQSYRATFQATPEWSQVRIPFAEITPHRVTSPFKQSAIRRIGLVAIGREFTADLCVAKVGLYAK